MKNEITINNWTLIEPERLEGHWITGEEIGRHLGYAEPRVAINVLYNRHKDRFENNVDVSDINLISEAGTRNTRVFSERGALKVIRYSNTKVADAVMNEVFGVYVAVRERSMPQSYYDHPLMIQAQQMMKITKNYLRVEAEQKRLAMEQAKHARDIQDIQAKTTAVLEKTGYYSILAYANIIGVKLPKAKAQRLGKEATKISKLQNTPISSVPDDRWGRANTYHKNILEDLMEQFCSES
jgi:prophage antirepressor-like protein